MSSFFDSVYTRRATAEVRGALLLFGGVAAPASAEVGLLVLAAPTAGFEALDVVLDELADAAGRAFDEL